MHATTTALIVSITLECIAAHLTLQHQRLEQSKEHSERCHAEKLRPRSAVAPKTCRLVAERPRYSLNALEAPDRLASRLVALRHDA